MQGEASQRGESSPPTEPGSAALRLGRATVDLGRPDDLEVAFRLGGAWRELRRGGTSTAVRDYFFGTAADAIDYGQMDTLDLLMRHPSWRMSDLAEALHVDPSTATRAVARLIAAGLAERHADDDDGRVVVVEITRAGRALHRDVDIRRGYVLSRLMSAFTRDEREQLATLMSRFVDALDDVVHELPAPRH